MKHKKLLGAGVVALSLAAGLATTAGASTDTTEPGGTDTAPSGECETVDEISLRLQWAIQAQFAGYIAARDTGIYERYCLDVEIIETGVDIVPQQDLADGNVDFALAWVPKALATREAGANIVNIAQIFQRSGTLQVSFVDAGITSPEDFEGTEHRQLGLRQRVRDLRRPGPGRARSGERRHARPAAVRHGRPARR